MFQTELALSISILFMNSNILQICTPLPLPTIDIPYVINKYVYIYGKPFVHTGVFYPDFITITKNNLFKLPLTLPDHRHFLCESYSCRF